MNTRTPQARLLRLVPTPTSTIDADMVAFTIMEFIDKNFPAIWRVLPTTARVQIRNAIVSAVRTQENGR
ncbi:hypothetical protein [Variovorax sp. ZT4R33]|uniref:hypothetical protein n=1 Tax=Variovorax sp. ZT4R33 TaxID=3443743 RepID=UPI003F48277D